MEFNNRLLLKIIELVITTSTIVLIESVANHGYSSEAMLVCGTLTGYLIICSALTIGHLLEAKLDKRIDILFAVAGCVLFISTGAIILDRWMNNYTTAVDKNTILSSGVLAFANGAVFIADTFGIAIGCIVLNELVDVYLSNFPMLVYGTIGGFTIICGVLLIGHVIGSVVEKRLNALISLLGCILFVTAGAMVIDKWHDQLNLLGRDNKRYAIATGSLMIINGAVFLLDTLSICRT